MLEEYVLKAVSSAMALNTAVSEEGSLAPKQQVESKTREKKTKKGE
jgi:hypothetical protein